MISYDIASYNMISYDIISYIIYQITSHHILWDIIWHTIWHIIPYHITYIISYHIMSYISYHTSYHMYPILSYIIYYKTHQNSTPNRKYIFYWRHHIYLSHFLIQRWHAMAWNLRRSTSETNTDFSTPLSMNYWNCIHSYIFKKNRPVRRQHKPAFQHIRLGHFTHILRPATQLGPNEHCAQQEMIMKSFFGVIEYIDDGRTDRLTEGLTICRFNFLRDFGHPWNFLKPDHGTIKMRPHKALDKC